MTAVLSATDALRRERIMSSHDDNQINYSPKNLTTEWKEKYYEAAEMLAETRAELDDFQHSSKELEEELEKELERTEKTQNELRIKVAKAETEREDWKSKFMSLQTTHNTTTTSLQRELDTLRQSYQHVKVQLRELEMGNDDLERNERAVSSSLADIESKYSRALEEKILLEHELLDKANLEEDCQRLKDELRDASLEITVLKNQLTQAQSSASTAESGSTYAPSSLMPHVPLSNEDIMTTSPPSDLLLSDLTSGGASSSTSTSTSRSSSTSVSSTSPTSLDTTLRQAPRGLVAGQSALLKRAGFQSPRINSTPSSSSTPTSLARSSTLPTFSPSRLPPRTPIGTSRPPLSQRTTAESSSESINSAVAVHVGTTSKSKGVQMVSEMRARVRNLEQRIHTRVPRLRLGSISGRSTNNTPSGILGSSTFTTPENSKGSLKRRSEDLENEKKKGSSNADKHKSTGDTSGWVLIMEDASSPTPTKDKEPRRTSSPSGIPFRPAASTNQTPGASSSGVNVGALGVRRPQSRLSVSTANASTTASTSSIPAPSSRPATPTFLPVPTSGMYGHGGLSLKRSTGPQQKRSSLGSSTTTSPTSLQPPQDLFHRERPQSVQLPPPAAANKALPKPPANVTIRAPRGSPAGGAAQNVLAQSRIGRPNSLGMPGGGRKSTGTEWEDGSSRADLQKNTDGRARAGSTSVLGRRLT